MIKRIAIVGILAVALVAALGVSKFSAYADDDKGQNTQGEQQKKEAHANGSTLEVHISDDGKVLVRGAKVTGISGSTVNAVTAWGAAAVNWAVVTDSSTDFIRRYGGASNLGEIAVGDYLSFQGMLDTTVTSGFTVKARTVKDWSIQKVSATFTGSVLSVNSGGQSFVLQTNERGNQTILVASSTKIMKGDAVGAFSDIAVGMRASVHGVWNTLQNTLAADSVKLSIPKVQTTVQGSLKSVTPLVLTVSGVDYTINVASDTSILNALWLRVSLTSFRVNDTVRVYGAVGSSTIDATVIRDASI